jgi:hypothetical protein
MNRVPALWTSAYHPTGNRVTRFMAKVALRALAFPRALAQADHDTFLTL